MIRVVLVDDHVLLRQGTAALLNLASDIEIVAETGLGAEAIELVRRLMPDVIVLDIRLVDMSGVEVARVLRQEIPIVKVLMLSAYQTEQYVRALFAIGVHGYLLKNASGTELINGVQAVYRGETVLSKEIAAQMASTTHRSGIAASDVLSDRECEVLVLVGQGASNKEIATHLGIGVRTVETHVSNAMAKLRARSRTEVVNIAVQRGIITLD
jgi:DNA-binding NarL/FixJ family response regulator